MTAEEMQYASYDSIRGPLRRAPRWVRAIDLDEIDRQRRLGFPDFYGDDFCERCGQRNPTWHIDEATWDSVVGDHAGGVLCPTCFTFAWEIATGKEAICELRIRSRGEGR